MFARRYAQNYSITTPNSATLPILTLLATTAVRPRLFEITQGSSSTPADNAGAFYVARNTTAGTAGSNPVPAPLDSSDPACATICGLATFSSTPPVITAATTLLRWAQNQRATFRWIAAPDAEFVAPATANNGFIFMNPSVNATFTIDGMVLFAE